jgi:hypothetical protein
LPVPPVSKFLIEPCRRAACSAGCTDCSEEAVDGPNLHFSTGSEKVGTRQQWVAFGQTLRLVQQGLHGREESPAWGRTHAITECDAKKKNLAGSRREVFAFTENFPQRRKSSDEKIARRSRYF